MVRLLVLGDSLAAGYHSGGDGPRFAPWAPLLRKLLRVTAVDLIGLSGYTTEAMVGALDRATVTDCHGQCWPGLRTQLRRARYHTVIILAGSNDIGQRLDAATIIDNLAKLCALSFPDQLIMPSLWTIRPSRAFRGQALRGTPIRREDAGDDDPALARQLDHPAAR